MQFHSSLVRRLSQEQELEVITQSLTIFILLVALSLRCFCCVWQGHQGCVNALAWNSNGSLLISGSDDLRVYAIFFCWFQVFVSVSWACLVWERTCITCI